MAKKHYFDPKEFVQKVLQDCKLTNEQGEVRQKLEDRIELALSDRITATIVANFDEREFALLEQIMEDHQELDEFDAISMIAPNVPGMQEELQKAIQDLYEELVHDAAEIDRALEMRKAAEGKK